MRGQTVMPMNRCVGSMLRKPKHWPPLLSPDWRVDSFKPILRRKKSTPLLLWQARG